MRQEDHFEFKVSLNYILIVAIYLPGSGFRTFLGPLLLSDKWFFNPVSHAVVAPPPTIKLFH